MPDRGAGGALQQTIMQPELHREPGLAASDTRTEGGHRRDEGAFSRGWLRRRC